PRAPPGPRSPPRGPRATGGVQARSEALGAPARPAQKNLRAAGGPGGPPRPRPPRQGCVGRPARHTLALGLAPTTLSKSVPQNDESPHIRHVPSCGRVVLVVLRVTVVMTGLV